MNSTKKYFFHEDNHIRELHIVDIGPDILKHLIGMFEEAHTTRGHDVIRHLPERDVRHAVARSVGIELSRSAASSEQDVRVSQDDIREPRHQDDVLVRRSPASTRVNTLNRSSAQFENYGYLVMGTVKILISIADVTKMDVDAIVNPTDDRLGKRENASMVISAAGGQEYEMAIDALRISGPLAVGDVIRTKPGRMRCGMVLHLVGPQPPYQNKEQCFRQLQMAFGNMIDYACASGIQTIAIPICNGMYMCYKYLFIYIYSIT